MNASPGQAPGSALAATSRWSSVRALVASHDWSASTLGALGGWPLRLRVAVDLVLDAPQPMAVLWGPQLEQIPNDAFVRDVQRGEPYLGVPARDAWAALWADPPPDFEAVLRGEPRCVRECRIAAASGQSDALECFDLTLSALRDDLGGIVGILVSAVDVSDRVRAASTLRDSENRFRALAEGVPAMVWACRPDGFLIYLNQRWIEYTGQSLDDYRGYGWAKAMHPDDRTRVLAQWEHCTRTGEAYEGEARYRRHDGVYRWHFFRGLPLCDQRGAISAWYGTSIDIENRKHAELQLRDREAYFKEIADAAPAMLWITDVEHQYTFLSRGWYDFTGLDEAAGPGSGWTQATHPDDRHRAAEVFLGAARQRAPFALDYRLRRRDGTYRWAADRGRPRYDAGGRFLGYIGSVIDIHERKHAEDALREADRRKDEFLAMLSHELRNPLAPLTNAHRILDRTEALTERGRGVLEIAKRQTRHMQRLVDDLLDVARITRGTIVLRPESVVLGDVIAHARDALRPVIDARQQTLALAMPHEPIELVADPARLRQILENLMLNASNYSHDGGVIRVEVEVDVREVAIRVVDEGVGIAAERIPDLFKLFSQLDSTLERARGGLGIGLALVRRLVELHGGSVGVASDGPGKGSTFSVRLPIA